MTSTIYVAGVAHVTLADYLSQIAIRDERIKELMAERYAQAKEVLRLTAEIAQYKAMRPDHLPDAAKMVDVHEQWMVVWSHLLVKYDSSEQATDELLRMILPRRSSPPIAERKDDALRQQVIATLTAIGLPSVMISGEGPREILRLLLEAAQGNPPAIGQSIGHPIGHLEPVHDVGVDA